MTRHAEPRVGATRFRRWFVRAAGVTLASVGAVCFSAAVASADDEAVAPSPLTSTVEKVAATAVDPAADAVARASQKAAEPVAKPVEKLAETVVKPVARPVQKVTETVAEPVEKAAEPVAKPVEKVAEPVAKPVEKVAEPVAKPVEKVAEPVADAVEPVATPATEAVVPLLPIVDAVVPVVEDAIEETVDVLQPIGVLGPSSGGDAAPGPASRAAGSPTSGTASPDAWNQGTGGTFAAVPDTAVLVAVAGAPAHVPGQLTTTSLSTPFTALAGGGPPLAMGAAGAANGLTAGGDTVAAPPDLPIQSAGMWLVPAADAFFSVPHTAFEIPVSPA